MRGDVKFGELLSKHTSFRIGGPADFWVEPMDIEDLSGLLLFLRQEQLPWMIFGNGTNLLVKDGGFRGVVVNLVNFRTVNVKDDCVTAGAGSSLPEILDRATVFELKGFEFTAGIPGTIGGAVVANAGGRSGEIGDIVRGVRVLNSGMNVETVSAKEMNFTYRNCSLPDEVIIIEVEIGLRKGKKENIIGRRNEILEYRRLRQPLDFLSAGCIFKNPDGQSAGELIEKAGLLGERIGGAEISAKHANFIINKSRASAEDVCTLIKMVEGEVFARLGIKLEREVKIVGD